MPEVSPFRCAVFGGSFDPIHEGHLEVARRSQEVFDLHRILWIPAAQPPHKLGRELAPAHMRLALCMIATAPELSWDVLPIELAREGPSYTFDTLLEVPDHLQRFLLPPKDGGIAERRRELELFMIIGSDNLPGLPGWKNAEDVLSIARPIVAWRADAEDGSEDAAAIDPEEGLARRLAGLTGRLSDGALERLRSGILALPPLPQSSTEIRGALAEGRVPDGALGAEVLAFIQEKGLYGWPGEPPAPPAPPASGDATRGAAGTESDPLADDPLGGDPRAWVHPGRRRRRSAGPGSETRP